MQVGSMPVSLVLTEANVYPYTHTEDIDAISVTNTNIASMSVTVRGITISLAPGQSMSNVSFKPFRTIDVTNGVAFQIVCLSDGV